MKKIEIPLIPNDDYDVIEYCGESTKFFDPPKGFEKIYDIINDTVSVYVEKNTKEKINKITIESTSEKVFDGIKANTIAYNLKEISEKYEIIDIEDLFNDDETIEQIMDILSILIYGKIVVENTDFVLCDSEDKDTCLLFAQKVYYPAKNEKINNPDYKNLYEMERNVLNSLANSISFAGLLKNNPQEARSIINMILGGEIFNEYLKYADVHEIIRMIDLFAKNYPKNSGEAVDYFIKRGNQMLPVYKEVYEYIDYYSKECAELDYTIVLKITKHCKELGIIDSKIIRERLSFTELKKLEKIMKKNRINNL